MYHLFPVFTVSDSLGMNFGSVTHINDIHALMWCDNWLVGLLTIETNCIYPCLHFVDFGPVIFRVVLWYNFVSLKRHLKLKVHLALSTRTQIVRNLFSSASEYIISLNKRLKI